MIGHTAQLRDDSSFRLTYQAEISSFEVFLNPLGLFFYRHIRFIWSVRYKDVALTGDVDHMSDAPLSVFR